LFVPLSIVTPMLQVEFAASGDEQLLVAVNGDAGPV
jgi:hypothetical protein